MSLFVFFGPPFAPLEVAFATKLHKVPDPVSLARRKYLAIPSSAENVYRNQIYEFIIVDFQLLEIRKSL